MKTSTSARRSTCLLSTTAMIPITAFAVGGSWIEPVKAQSTPTPDQPLVVNSGQVNVDTATRVTSLSGNGGMIRINGDFALTVDQATDTIFRGSFSADGPFGSSYLVKSGAGTLTLAGSATVTRGRVVDVTAGTLQLTGGSALGDSDTLNITGGTVRLLSSENIGRLAGTSGGTLDINGQFLTIGPAVNASAVMGANIIGNGIVIFQGPGLTTTLAGNNSFSGQYEVSGGVVNLSNQVAFNSAARLVVNGGSFNLNGQTTTLNRASMSFGEIATQGTLRLLTDYNQSGGTISASTTVEVSNDTRLLGGTIAGTLVGRRPSSIDEPIVYATFVDGSQATTVTGALSLSHGLEIGAMGRGTLILSGGGQAFGNGGLMSRTAGSDTTVEVRGIDSRWELSRQLTIGIAGTANLTIAGGGVVEAPLSFVAQGVGSQANVIVTGAGSQLASEDLLILGTNGRVNLTIADGAAVSSRIINAASFAGSGATITFGAAAGTAAVAPGTLSAPSISFGAGDGNLVFNHTATDYVFSPNVSGEAKLRQIAGTTRINGRLNLSGAGAVAVEGGMLRLFGNNSFANAIAVSGGTLFLGSNNAAGGAMGQIVTTGSTVALGDGVTNASSIVIASNNTEIEVATGTATQSGVISEQGAPRPLEKIGAGTLVLTAANTYTGTTTISAGTLQIGNGGTSGTMAGGAIVNNAALVLNRADDIVLANAISGTGSLTKRGAGVAVLTGANSFSGLTTISTGTLQIGNGGTGATLGSGDVQNDGLLVVNSASDVTISGAISGAGALFKRGSGALTLSGANTYTGATRIEAGTIALGMDNTLSQGSPIDVTGGTLSLGTFGSTVTSVNLSAGSIAGSGGTLTVAGNYTQSGGTIGAGATVEVNGNVLLSGGSIAGELNGRSTAATAAVVEGGRVSVTGDLFAAGSLRVGNVGSGTLLVVGGGSVSSPLATIAHEIGSSGSVTVSGTGSLWSTDGITVGRRGEAELAITAGGTVTGSLSTIGGFVTGRGTVTVSGAGSEFQNSSELFVGNSGSGTLNISAGAAVKNTNGSVAGFGGGNGSVSVTGAGSQWINDGFLQVGRLGTGTLSIAEGGEVTSTTGTIGTGPLANGTVTVFGPGGNWTMTGALVVGSRGIGNLTLADEGLVAASGVTIASDATGTGTINIGAAANAAATAAGALDVATIAFGTGTGSIVFNHTSPDFALSAAISGRGTIRQVAGTTTLSGANGAFTGNTQITGGSLLVTGELGSNVAVDGGTLGGTGTLLSRVTINAGGMLESGTLAAGTLTVGTLTLNTGSTNIFELGQAGVAGGANNDLIRVTGDLVLNGGTINVVRGSGFGSGQYTLFEYGSLSGSLGNLTLGSIGGGFVGGLALGESTVLLNVGAADDINWWNGSTTAPAGMVEGGDGVWSLAGGNFTNAGGIISAAWAGNGRLAVFGGNAGTVTIAQGEALSPSGLNFLTDGYVITGGDANSRLTLDGPTGIDTATGVGATIAAVISGTGSLTKTGGGTLTLTANNIYSGPTSILGGTLDNRGTILGGLSVFDGAAFDNRAGATLSGAATIGAGGTLTNGGTIVSQVTNNGALTSTGTLGNLANNANATAVLAGATRAIANAGTVTVTGNLVAESTIDNLASGRFTVSAAVTLQALGTVTNRGTAADAFTINGTLETAGLFQNTAGASLLVASAGTLSSSGEIRNASGGLITNVGTVNGGVENAGSFVTTGTVVGTLVNLGSGTASLAGTLAGDIDNSGVIALAGTTTGIGQVRQASGGVFDLAGFNTTIGSLAGGGGVALGSGTLTTGTNNANTSFAGVITGSGGLTKVGNGTLTLDGVNTFTGMTTVNAGTLAISAGAALAGGATNNAALDNAGSIGGLIENNAALTNSGTISAALLNAAGASATNTGSIAGDVDNAGTLTNSGAISGAVGNSGRASNSGTMDGGVTNSGILASTGTLMGLINRVDGTTSVEGVLIGAIENEGRVTLTGTTTGIGAVTQGATGVFDLAITNTAIGSLAGAGSVVLGGSTLTTGGNNAGTSFGGVIAGSGGLNKVGDGTLTLAGANTFTGLTTVTGGTLAVAQGGALVGAVRNNAALSNAGSIAGLTENTGALTNSGTISGALANAAGAGAANSGNIAGDVSNAGSLGNSGMITGLVTNIGTLSSTGTLGGGLVNAAGASAQIRGVLSGVVENAGTITLTGTVTGIGAVTQGEGGVLDLAGNSTAPGSLAGAGSILLGSATLTTGSSNASTLFSGVIAGSGGLTKTGSGTFTLGGANTFTGLTTISAGTLAISAGAALAGGAANNAVLTNAGAIAGAVSNAGTLSNSGSIAGIVTNSGALSSTGTLGGGLVNAAGANAQIRGVLSGAVENAGTITLTGAVTGIGAVTQGVGGVLDLAGNSTAIGSLAGSGSVLLGAGTLTTGSSNASTLFSGVIAGSGGLAKTGSGTFTLTGANTFTGPTTITGGALRLGDGGTTGGIGTGAVTLTHGALVIDRSNAVSLANAISGTGMLVQDGAGTTTLTGTNTYTGGTLVNGGRLTGNTAALQGAIQNNAVLEFALGANGTFAGALSGAGRVEKTGAGVLTIAGNGAALTGPFAVLGGGLRLDGTNGGRLDRSVVTLASGTTLSGSGLIGGLVAQGGALVTPGNSLGVIAVTGDVTLNAGSRYLAEVSQLGADLITAGGSARLGGALDVVNIGAGNGYRFNASFALVEASGGVQGSFDQVTFNGFSPIYRPTLRSSATGLQLVLAPGSLATLAGTGLTGNQAAVAARFDAAVAAGFDPQDFFAVYNLAPAQLRGALDQLSGEIHPAMGRAAMRQSRLPREAVLERAGGVAMAGSPQGNSWGSWGKLMRSWGDVEAGDGTAAQATDTEGFIAGFDGGTANDSRSLRFGVYGSYLDTRIRIDALGSNGRIEQTGGGVYASLALGGLSLVAGGGASHFDITTQRVVDVPGLADSTASASTGDMAQMFGRIGYRFDLGAVTLEPFAAGDAAWIAIDPVRERGERGDAAAVAVSGQDYAVASASTGIAAKARLGMLRIDTEAAARFELGDRAPQALIALAQAPGQATGIAATRLAGTAFVGRFGAILPIGRRIEARLDYAGEFSRTDKEHTAKAGISIAF